MGKLLNVEIPEDDNGKCVKINSKGIQITENKPKIILGEKDGVPTHKKKCIIWENQD